MYEQDTTDNRLDLFFAGMRLFGQEFHIPRFFAR